jgi:uncharacterized sulfatase
MKLVPWIVLVAFSVASGLPAAERPNVILILADDLGWADLPAYGNRFHETPRLDRLAREGLRFTRFYAGPVCSPTRANVQTGLDQARFGITQHIPGHRRPYAKLRDPEVPSHLPAEAETIAERLRAVGYATGYFGKWHLGGAGHGPETQGWDTVRERKGNVQPPSSPGGPERRTAAVLAEDAEAFLAAHRDRPFLLQISHAAVHIPLSTTPALLAKYQAKPKAPEFPCDPAYAGLLEELDASVGRVVDAVDAAGLADRTLIFFFSDNGGLEHEQSGRVVTSNQPWRGEKGTLYEGGVRVPALARWPGTIPPGGVCDVAAMSLDLFPTLAALAGAAPRGESPGDGVSLVPLFAGGSARLPRESLHWHLPHYHHATPAGSILRGDWKLIEWFEGPDVELFDLSRDPGERRNLAAEHPERVRELRSALAAWRERVGARMPVPNPDHDPARAAELAGGKSRAKAAPESQAEPVPCP